MAMGSNVNVTMSEAELGEFIKALDNCKGQVFLVTDEGDRINMKSQLCRMIGIHHIIAGGKFSGGKLECENPEDASLLFRFNLYGSVDENK
ncbi:hypothetical protein [Yeguia hominis]|nr:hypothetical protein [Yeguia hominis]